MSLLYLLLAALFALIASAKPIASAAFPQLHRRADNVVFSWPLRRHYRGSSGRTFSLSVSADIASDWNGGMSQGDFALTLDSGSDRTWVHSNLIPMKDRHVGKVYYPPQHIFERHEAQAPSCDVAAYQYGAGLVRVQNFETTVTVGRQAMTEVQIGAAYEINGRFQELPSTIIGDGIFGMSPEAAKATMSKLRLDARAQFLLDVPRAKLSFGDFGSSLLWLPGSVDDAADKWIVPEHLTNIGRIHIDTAFSAIVLRKSLLDYYFQLYPTNTWREDSGRYLISCDDAARLPPLTIHFLDSRANLAPREGGLTAEQLKGSEKYTRDGKKWCLTPLAELTAEHVLPEYNDIVATLGMAWLEYYNVGFDPYKKSVGLRPASS